MLGSTVLSVLFLPLEIHGAGVFVPAGTLKVVKLLREPSPLSAAYPLVPTLPHMLRMGTELPVLF